MAHPRTLRKGLRNRAESHPCHPMRLRSLHWVVGLEAGWGKGPAGVGMLSQLSLGGLCEAQLWVEVKITDYVLKAALSSRKAAWRSLLFSSSCFRSSCSAFSSASNLLAEDKAWTCRERAKTDQRSEQRIEKLGDRAAHQTTSCLTPWDRARGKYSSLWSSEVCCLSVRTPSLFAALSPMPQPLGGLSTSVLFQDIV